MQFIEPSQYVNLSAEEAAGQEIMQAPLQFIDPAIRAFEPQGYSIPQQPEQPTPAENVAMPTTRDIARTQARLAITAASFTGAT